MLLEHKQFLKDLWLPSRSFWNIHFRLASMKTHTCDAWGLQVGIKSKGGQVNEKKKGHLAVWLLVATDWQQRALMERGWKKAFSCTFYHLRMSGGALNVKDDRSCWNVQRSQCLSGGRVWQWRGAAIVAAWSLIKVQMPSEEFLQKNSTVIAIYRSCLGYSFSKYSLLYHEK